MSRATKPHVAIGIETLYAYERDFLSGVIAYARTRGDWDVLVRGGIPAVAVEELLDWRGDGMIAQIRDQEMLEALRQRGIPMVNVSGDWREAPVPQVQPDYQEVGRQAGEDLLAKGFRHFAFFCETGIGYSLDTGIGFRECVEAAGRRCHWHDSAHPPRREADREELSDWLLSLPKPVAVLTCMDFIGRQVIDVCRDIGVLVPEEVAVIGQSNDRLVCELPTPHLSSVDLAMDRVGYETAALLDRLMDGGPAPEQTIRVAPRGVVTRESSDTLAVEDPEVVKAIRFIRANGHRPIWVEDVVAQVHIGRRTLERRFLEMLGYSPAVEISRAHLERAKDLLVHSDMAVAEVAEASGFSSSTYMQTLFRRKTGVTPMEFRKQYRNV